jgi:hypothetical protein
MAAPFAEAARAMRGEAESGPEDENNWKRRNDMLRRFSVLCDACDEPPRDLFDTTKPLFQYILSTCATERTTLSISAMACLSSIFKILGHQMVSQLDIMLPALITLCGAAKKLTSKSAGNTIEVICAHVGYSSKLITHTCEAFKEKPTAPRLYAATWLTQIFDLYGKSLDPVRDHPKIDAAFLIALNDSQTTVREAIRPAYWRYAKIASTNAATIMDNLPKDKANALRNHKDNPDKPADAGRPARPTSALAQIKARNKALKSSTVTKSPAADKPALSTSASSHAVHKSSTSATMAAAPARMPGRTQTAPHTVTKRDITHSSSHTSEYATGPIDRVDAPDGVLVPLPSSPRDTTFADMEARANFDKATAAKKKARHGPEYGDRPELSTSEKARNDEALLRHLATKNPEASATTERQAKEETVKARQVDNASLRNLMAAPVRRPRIVATPINPPQAPVRPSSKGELKKSTSSTGRSTPNEELIARGHKKQASSRSGRQTPTIREDPAHQKKPSISRTKAAAVTDSRPSSSSSSSKLRIDSSSDPVAHSSSTEPPSGLATSVDSADPIPPVSAEQPETKVVDIEPEIKPRVLQPLDLEPTRPPSQPRIIDGKENTFSYDDGCSHKKAYEACTGKANEARSEVQRIKDALKAGKLDALGHKKLSGMLKNKPKQLITNQKDYNELYTILVEALAASATIAAPPGNSAKNPGHPFYNRHALLDSITRLREQWPDAGEPHFGMALIAVIKCAATHNGGRFRAAATIEDAASTLVGLTHDDHLLATIDNTADFIIEASLQNQMTIPVMSLGLRSLGALLNKATSLSITLYEVQERLIVDVATTAIKDFRGELGREVLTFVTAMRGPIRPDDRLVSLFEADDDRNLVTYYLGR